MKKISALALAAMLAVSMNVFAGDAKSCDPKSCDVKTKSCDKDKKECKDAKCEKHCPKSE